jgi:lysophospholipase L1-like esterase
MDLSPGPDQIVAARSPRRRALASGVAMLLLALTGCSGDGGGSVAAERPEPELYVALGDSFTAAPYVPSTSLADGCFRSDGNYPRIVAAELGAELRDVSCSGANTSDLTDEQSVAGGRGTVPPQLDAVTPDADVVTVSIGGNDENLFRSLIVRCTALAEQPGTPCADRLTDEYGDTAAVITAIGDRVAGVLDEARTAASDARVVLVGYPRMVSADEPCAAMPLAAGDRPLLARMERQLNQALRRAARRSGAEFADLHRVSSGHEICSDDPWVNGSRTDQARALAFHPFAEGQEAVAEVVLELLGERP